MGLQHILAVFGATFIAPLLMGFDTNTALFFSGLGTIIFYVATGGRVPSFVGSSFAFIGVVVSATGYNYETGIRNEHLDVAVGGILVCGLVLAAMGIIVMFVGHTWIEAVMPPVVTGTVVMIIGVHLSSAAFTNATGTSFDAWMAFVTIMSVSIVSVYAPGMLKRMPILTGLVVGYVTNLIIGVAGHGTAIDFTAVKTAPWFGVPHFTGPKFEGRAISIIVPVCVVLLAENLGHLKAVAVMVDRPLDKYLGRAILGDAVATIVSASGGGPGTTTYAENIGVMAVTQMFSSLIFLIAGFVAIFLSFIQKIGAVIHTIPNGVFGGLSIILFGLITVSGARIWVENQVDFKDSRNMLVAGIPVIIGAAMQITLQWGNFQLDGIGLATYSAILLYQILFGFSGIRDFFRYKSKPSNSNTEEQQATSAI
ncbi:putative pyrimidine permease RutG isoform X2 [Bradysia coprophila]|nr:putative pyrimidine permease RutG isoform X2 [Bradysia coprophila]